MSGSSLRTADDGTAAEVGMRLLQKPMLQPGVEDSLQDVNGGVGG